jgi:putative endonuclease
MFYFYIFKCKDGTLYSGITNNLSNREKAHNSGRGSKYVRAHGGGKIVYSERFYKLSNALRREIKAKKLTRSQKQSLIKKSGIIQKRKT